MATTTPTPGTQSIDRAAQLLVHVVETAEPPTVGELSERSGLPKSTTSRLVAALERQGLVQRDAGRGVLTPGPVLSAYARRAAPGGDLVALAAASLDRLARRERRDRQPRHRDRDGCGHARPARQPSHPRLHELGRAQPSAPRLRGRQGLPRRGRRPVSRGARSSGSARRRSPSRRRCDATSSSRRRAAMRPPSRSSSRDSGPSPRPSATPPVRSSRRSASPAPPRACTTARSTSSARSCGTRPLRCQSATATTTPSEVLHERR